MSSRILERFGLRARLIASVTLIFGATLIAHTMFLFDAVTDWRAKEFDAALYNYAIDLSKTYQAGNFDAARFRTAYAAQDKILPFALVRTVTRVVEEREADKPGVLPAVSDEELARIKSGQLVFRDIRLEPPERRSYRLVDYYLPGPEGHGKVLQVAAPTTQLESETRKLLFFLWLSIPFILLASVLAAWLVSARAFAPVRRIIEKTKAITHRRMSERLPVPAHADELRELVLTLNDLLARLEAAFQSQENFVADASHQLKTPLALLRTELDLMRARGANGSLDGISEEVNYLSRLVERLLTLARVDVQQEGGHLSRVRVDETVLDAMGRLKALVESRGLTFDVNLVKGDADEDSPFEVPGDPDLVRCLHETLIENAVKYSGQGKSVGIEVADRPREVEIAVRDQGVGIAADRIERIFERFYRSPDASASAEGSGLGLAIAKRIVEVHQGRIGVESLPGAGSCFRVVLPKD